MVHTVGYTNSASYKCLENIRDNATDLYLTYCGWEVCDPGHRYGPNKRSTYVLHIIQSGKGIFEIDHMRYSLGEGDAFLIPSNIEAWYEADMEEPWSYHWIGFEGVNAKAYTENAGFSMKNPVRKIECMAEANGYIDRMLECHQLFYENELKRNALLRMLIAELITDNRKNFIGDGKPLALHRYPSSVYVEHAVEYMDANFSKRLKINEMADYIGVNRSYLTSCFQKNMGCSPQEYLMNLRIEKAKMLLKKKDIQVNEVASMVGYADPLAFSKIFKRRTGYSPREYKDDICHLVIQKRKGDFSGCG